MFGLAASLFTTLTLAMFQSAHAERPGSKEWVPRGARDPMIHHELPMFFRSSAGTAWVRVHNPGSSPCSPADTADSPNGQTIEHVWCFEGANGDSLWENQPGKHWDHWSLYNPPITPLSKWHMSRLNPNASTWNAWAGCDSIPDGSNFGNNDESCEDIPFWSNKKGYGDNWNYALELVAGGAPNGSGSTIRFDVRYDTECNYDYLYVEYSTNNGTTWSFLRDSYPNGTPAVFNSVSGNPDSNHGGTGRACGTDYFGNSDQQNGENYNGSNHSLWLAAVDFPIPAAASGGVRVRWRAFSDGAWSDQDGRGDTDGMAAIDNILLTVSGGTTATDNFENATGSSVLNGRVIATENISGAVTWSAGGVLGNTYDGWHLQFNPNYSNKGNTCDFSDDWMWAAKPAASAIPPSANGFDFFLASPVINSDGWTGGVVEYAGYLCMLANTDDFSNTLMRFYDTASGSWSPWNDFDGFITFAGCEFWNINDNEDLTQYLGTTIDSLQVGWECLDINKAGDFLWGKHGAVQYLVDNVSFGSFDGTSTVFTARVIDIYADTFSQSDPAHTPFLQNAEQGIWSGLTAAPQGTRDFANADSLTVEVNDFNGVTASNVDLWWRHDNGGVGFGAFSKIDMTFSLPNPTSPTDEGTYNAIIGKDNGGVEDAFPPSGNRKIWKPATTVQYYMKVVDNAAQTAVFPNTADDAEPIYFEFSVLPFGKTTVVGQKILLIDDFTRNMLDFENSGDFDATGGTGFGDFLDPIFEQPEDMVEDALALLFGGSEALPKWDKYDVQGGGSSVQCEPRGIASSTLGLGGYMTDVGNPNYDVLIWLQGSFDEYSLADTTRIELRTYLDRNGNLFLCGDDLAYHLGSGGNNADSALGFLGDYLGIAFPVSTDDETLDRVLNTTGSAGTELANVELGLYGECPIRRAFDRLTLGVPATGSQNSVLATYTDSNQGADNGRPSIIKNIRRGLDASFNTADDGVAVTCGFDISANLSRASMACLLGKVLGQPAGANGGMGITLATPPACVKNGVDAPVVEAHYGFQLANATPNPFTKETTIRFSIASKTHVSVEVYNILGQKVRTLVDETLDANSYSREWDGRSDSGEKVSNGIYFYKMVAGDFSDTKKAVLLK
jgi:hypothetical protein